LNRLLAQALEIDAPHRDEWLAALPESDRDLAPVLEQLLAQASTSEVMQTSDAMPRLRSDAFREAASAAAARCIDEQPGTQVGPYRLLRALGTGGMGTVWLAERPDGVIERQVALKLPHAEWTDRGLADRMARERAVLASLNHPNIAQLFDAGWASDGRPYLALEYVEGEPIDTWCRRKQLAPAARMRLFVDVVRAVAFAHAKLVIHRDIKPSNVLVTEEGRVKLLDFGIAKLLSAEAALTEETALTRFAGRALTLNYAAPEQVLGQPISTAADTYSLGVMLFELMSGERPYRVLRDSRSALEDAIVNAEIPAPSSVTANKATARILRGDLDTIILKALRKQPEQRYETAAALADDIERWLDQRPVRAQRASNWYRTRRFLLRHRLGVMTGTVAFSALLVGGGIALWKTLAADEEAARTNAVRDFVLSIIAQADPAATRETRAADLTLLTTAENRLTQELVRRPELTLELRLAIANAYRNRGEFNRASETLRLAINEARTALPADDLNLMRAWVRIADSQLSNDEEVKRELDATIDRARLLGRGGARLLVEGLSARAQLRKREGVREEGLADVREAHAVAVRHFGPGSPLALDAAATSGELGFYGDELLPLIASAYKAALDNPDLSSAHPSRIWIQSIYGNLLCVTGRGREGLELLHASERIAREHHGGSLPTEHALAHMRVGFYVTGDARGAMAAAEQALALATSREPPGAYNRSIRTNMFVMAAIDARQIDEAMPLVSELEALITRPEGARPDRNPFLLSSSKVWLMNLAGDTVGAEDLAARTIVMPDAISQIPVVARDIRLGWSFALRQNGKALEAEKLLAALPDARLGILNEDENFLSESAAVRLAAGDALEALGLADRALARFERMRLQVDPALSDLLVTRGRALLALQRPAEAREAFRVAADFWREYDDKSHWSAEASYWLARALIETGDRATGQPMLNAMRTRLAKSPMPSHRALATLAAVSR